MVRRIHIGFDESNHESNPEVIAGVFSNLDSDAQITRFPANKKFNHKKNDEFFTNHGRCWKMIAIPKRFLTNREVHPIIYAAPAMIEGFMGNNFGLTFNFNILIDGGHIKGIHHLENYLSNQSFIEDFNIRMFPKVKSGDDNSFDYAQILQAADYVATNKFRTRYSSSKPRDIVYRESAVHYNGYYQSRLVSADIWSPIEEGVVFTSVRPPVESDWRINRKFVFAPR